MVLIQVKSIHVWTVTMSTCVIGLATGLELIRRVHTKGITPEHPSHEAFELVLTFAGLEDSLAK